MVRLEINTLGSGDARQQYRSALVSYLSPLVDQLDEDSRRRLDTNPMRILDSKNPETQRLLENAPKLPDFVDAQSIEHFNGLKGLLRGLGIPFQENPNLVRGLDYYTHTVFEWITDDLGAQGAICAGGRYDGLVERLGGRATPGVGFAIGLDRAVLLHEVAQERAAEGAADVYVCVPDQQFLEAAMQTAQALRSGLPISAFGYIWVAAT